MSAREQLIREMTHNHLYMTPEQANELVDDLIHELAEQQRKWAKDHGVPLEDDQYVTAGDVINLIDPKVAD